MQAVSLHRTGSHYILGEDGMMGRFISLRVHTKNTRESSCPFMMKSYRFPFGKTSCRQDTMGILFYQESKIETASQNSSNSGQRHKQPSSFRNGFLEAFCVDCALVQKGSFKSDKAICSKFNHCRWPAWSSSSHLFRTGAPF